MDKSEPILAVVGGIAFTLTYLAIATFADRLLTSNPIWMLFLQAANPGVVTLIIAILLSLPFVYFGLEGIEQTILFSFIVALILGLISAYGGLFVGFYAFLVWLVFLAVPTSLLTWYCER